MGPEEAGISWPFGEIEDVVSGVGGMVLRMGARISDRDETAGYVLLSVDLDRLLGSSRTEELGEGGYVAFFDRENDMLFYREPETGALRVSGIPLDLEDGYARIKEETEGCTSFTRDGERGLASCTALDRPPWTVAAMTMPRSFLRPRAGPAGSIFSYSSPRSRWRPG